MIIALEHLEKAYVRDSVNDKDYQTACKKLLAQFKTLHDSVGAPSIEEFTKEYNLSCSAALNRLKIGVPATTEHPTTTDKKKELAVFHAVQHFITMMDSLKLNMRAVDELHPTMSDLMDSINKVSDLPPDHPSKLKVKQWLVKLNAMRAHDELKEEDVRQMSFDLDQAYNSFHRFVQEK
eukprot:TRINITY_DN11501_c0_g1_i1.p1 TRINITY_DN11501_c0_g1~~TRINITY_DN11501_c0_g1_i1.p1  ORF type:complete len:179 (-),score=23.20 TRINITY_DN11501_c0_g1_i1:78-614(-)